MEEGVEVPGSRNQGCEEQPGCGEDFSLDPEPKSTALSSRLRHQRGASPFQARARAWRQGGLEILCLKGALMGSAARYHLGR